LVGDLELQDGYSYIHNKLRIGFFTQHHVDNLDLRVSAVEQMMEKFGPYESEAY